MKLKSKNQKICLIMVCIISLPVFLTAQSTQVIAIDQGGTRTSQAVLNIMQPQQKAKNYTISVGNSFPSGTTINTPPNTTLRVGANGNQQDILPNSQHNIRITPKMEIHKTITGKVVHYKNNHDPKYVYKATSHSITANPQGTIFSVTVQNNNTRIDVQKGKVIAAEKVNVKVNETSKNNASQKNRQLTGTKTQTLGENQSQTFDDQIDYVYYDTYEQAIAEIRTQLNQDLNIYYLDPELIGDEYLVLGELLLDEGYTTDAINYFNEAIGYYQQVDFSEIYQAEANLLIAEAYWLDDRMDYVNYHTDLAIRLITPVLNYDIELYNYAYEMDDTFLMEEIAIDLFYDYDFMGWAYELKDNWEMADKYYDAADSLPYSGY
jgi:tetratricopeptide (TPR) repeat protein